MKWEYLIIFYSFESAEWRQILNDETSVLKFTQSVILVRPASNSDYIVEQGYIFKRPVSVEKDNK